MDVPVICTLTRFRLRSARHLLPTYRHYHEVVREARAARTPGFLQSAFLLENPLTWYSLSIWSDANAISHFGTNVPAHVDAARRFFPRLADSGDGPELWSTKWRLASVSHNLNWPGFELRDEIARAEA